MNASEIEGIKQQLLLLRLELQDIEDTSKKNSKPIELDQARVGRLSRIDAMQAQQMAQEVARRRQHQLRMIEGALRRIESGEYGYCFVCGEEIDVRRLAADPSNTHCIVCVDK